MINGLDTTCRHHLASQAMFIRVSFVDNGGRVERCVDRGRAEVSLDRCGKEGRERYTGVLDCERLKEHLGS